MQPSRQLAAVLKSLARHWRVRPYGPGGDRGQEPWFVRPLEDRRVLSAAAIATLVPPGAEGGIGGGGASPEASGMALANSDAPASGDTSQASQQQAEPQTSAAQLTTETIEGDKSAAALAVDISDNLENGAATSDPPTAEPALDEFEIGAPVLTVAQDQQTSEGTELAITDIGKFTAGGLESGEPSQNFTYSIDWGDGTPVDSGLATIDVPGDGEVPTQGSFDGAHIYADNGVYTVTITLNDDLGHTVSDVLSVTVDNVSPTLSVPQDQTVDEGAQLDITNIGQFTDPGFDNPLNVGGETSEKFTYSIDWGDGTTVDSGAPTIDVPGGANVPTQGSFDGSHLYADNGVYTVTVTVSDDDGGMAVETFLVTVNNVAPTLTVPQDQAVDEGAQLDITNIGQFTDPGFDNPLNVGGETSEKFTYSIDWGDGTSVDSGSPTIDVPGSPGVPTQGSFDGSHIYADNGVYTVTVTVSDDDGGMAVETFLVTVNNVAPTLTVPQDQTVDEGAQLDITNIGQFTDPGFDNPLNVGGETSEKFTYSIDWGDGSSIDSGSPTIDVPGGPGVLTQGSFDGSHIYADNGLYTVTVTVSDDDGGMAVETFLVTVNNVAPTLTVPQDQTVDEGAQLDITNIGQFTDPGFDNPLNVGGETSEKFTYSIDWGDGSSIDSGSPTIDVPGGPGVLTQGSFDGSHIYADNGVYTVTVTVSDDDGGMAVETFLVTVGNVAPTLTVPPNQTVNEGSELSIPNIGQFTDPGYDNPANPGGATTETFSYSIDWGDGRPVDSGMATIDVPGGPGVLTQGSFDGAHTYADNGVYTVTVTVSDDDGGTTVETFLVTVNNVAPTLVVPGDQTVNQGDPLALAPIGQYTDPGFDNPLNVGGETTERFTFAVDWGDGSPLDSGSAPINMPGGVGVLTAGSFNGSHTYTATGVYTVTVTVSDDDGGTTSGTFLVTVASVQPILLAGPDQTINEGAPLSVSDIGKFSDPSPSGGGPYTFSIDWGDGLSHDSGTATIDTPGTREQPALGSFDGAHTYADNGVYTVTISITTADGRTATDTLQVTVANVAPTLTSIAQDITVPQSQPITFQDLARYTDPGFDNPLNVGGEISERFTVSINWGDGSPVTIVPGVITAPGAVGVLTSGTSSVTHVFSSVGTTTVTVTVSDDDGGSVQGQFNVTVGPLPHPPFVFRNDVAAGGTLLIPEPLLLASAGRPFPSPLPQRVDAFRVPVASVAGAEPRLVLRVVSPAGVEDKENEEPLSTEVLDNLRKLFVRLPDGRYRIYQIEPDGIERLVVDVFVREGHAIDAADEQDALPELVPQPAEASPEALPEEAPDAETDVRGGAREDAESASLEGHVLEHAALAARIDRDAAVEGADQAARLAEIAAVVASGGFVYFTPERRKLRQEQNAPAAPERVLSKGRRWLKRPR